MGDSETGGGASVHWKVDANDVSESHDNPSGPGRKHHQDGTDQEGKVGDFFTVSIKRPADGSTLTMIPDGNRVYINLPIEKDETQIRISWGESNNHRGVGGPKRPGA